MSSSSLLPTPNTSSISSAVQSNAGSQALQQLSGNLDTFLKMLMTQLQNQDPTQPMDTAQFTQQLVEYSQIEQQIQTNQSLSTISGNIKASAAASAIGYMGRNVTIDGQTQALAKDGALTWSYTLPSSAQAISLTVTDSAGKTVTNLQGNPSAGTHTVNWDGLDAKGNVAPPGNYTLTATALDGNGAPITVNENTSGTVTGVSFDSSGNPQVIIGGKAYAAGNILSIGAQSTSP